MTNTDAVVIAEPVFSYGELQTAYEVFIVASEDEEFYRARILPVIDRLVGEYKDGDINQGDYHPLVAVHIFMNQSIGIFARNAYFKCTGDRVFMSLNETVAIARYFEHAYRGMILDRINDGKDDHIKRTWACDSDLVRNH